MPKSNSTNSQSTNEARRNLLKVGTCGAMTNATFLSTLMHLKMTSALMADPPVVTPTGGYKALVCLFFNGAIDGFNVLTPYGTTQGDTHYADYALTRGGAALKRTAAWDSPWVGTDYGYLKPIFDSASGRTFGLHPRFTYLKQIYDAGHATFVANTGALVERLVNNNDYNNAAKIKPLGLYSHPDQQRHWQTAVPTSRNQVKGWAGKMTDLFTDSGLAAAQQNVYAAISTAGQSILLTGDRTRPYAISSNGAVLLAGPGNANPYDRIYTGLQTDLASQTYSDLLEKTIRNNRVEAREAALAFQGAFASTTLPSSGLPFPTSGLGASLSAVAKSIKIASSSTAVAPLKQERQVFLVQVGGWDHHANLIANQDTMIPAIDNGLKAFYDFLVAENLLNKVTLFSISDFARTLSFNGSGTDHAWGSNPIVMGGAVNGGRIYGTYPNIVLDTSGTGIDRGRGVLIPQTSTDEYHAEICEWFGLPNNSNMQTVLPNIRNFYSAGSSHPLGFLNY